MDISVLSYIFTVSIIVGFAIPIINIVTGAFGSLFNFGTDMDVDLDLDVDLDVSVDVGVDVSVDAGADAGFGGADSGVFPFNFLCLCLFLIVFGVTGNVFLKFMSSTLMVAAFIAASLAIGALFYWLMYKFVIVKLKKSTVPALTYDALRGKSAEVTMKISGETMGMVSVLDSTGAYISFRAKRDPALRDVMAEVIDKGRRVTITEVDKNEKLCYVSTSPTEFTSKTM